MYKSKKKLGSKYFVTQSYQINLAAILVWVKMINPHLILLLFMLSPKDLVL